MPATQTAMTLANLYARALSNETKGLGGISFLSRASGLHIVVSGEGSRQKAEIETIASRLSILGDAARVGTDLWEDYEGGMYTCLWINLEAAERSLEAAA